MSKLARHKFKVQFAGRVILKRGGRKTRGGERKEEEREGRREREKGRGEGEKDGGTHSGKVVAKVEIGPLQVEVAVSEAPTSCSFIRTDSCQEQN